MKRSIFLALLVGILFFQGFIPAGSLALGPGWHSATATPVSLEEAANYFQQSSSLTTAEMSTSTQYLAPASGTSTSLIVTAASAGATSTFAKTNSVSTMATTSSATVTPEIKELARSLKHDPKLIYDYVHNHIDYVPYFGALKGATLTYLEESGNDFDQAALMIALLRACEIESAEKNAIDPEVEVVTYNAKFIYGRMTIPTLELSNWLGVDQDDDTIRWVLGSGGMNSDPPEDGYVTLNRVWVKATIDGVECLFDPAFKKYWIKTKIDVKDLFGYDRAIFLDAARTNGTVHIDESDVTHKFNDYVINVNETKINEKLMQYASGLVASIKAQFPNDSIEEFLGSRTIISEELANYETTLPFTPVEQASWIDVPHEYTAYIDIMGWPVYTPGLSGSRLTVTFAGDELYHRVEVRLNGDLIAWGNEATTPGSTYNMNLKFDHPYAANGGKYKDDLDPVTYIVKSGATYALVYNFGGTGEEVIKKSQKRLQINKNQSHDDTSEVVLGETLHLMGETWLREVQLERATFSRLFDIRPITHHAVGVMAQEDAYYIDVKQASISGPSQHNTFEDSFAYIKSDSLIASALEHSVLEQFMDHDPANPQGVSTIKLLQIANSAGQKIFWADPTNYQAVSAQLQYYPSVPALNTEINSDDIRWLILPEYGSYSSGAWNGSGYVRYYYTHTHDPETQEITAHFDNVEMTIKGGHLSEHHGGDLNAPLVANPVQVLVTDKDSNPEKRDAVENRYTNACCGDPVDMLSGAFFYDRTDIALGGGAPRGLSFSPYYTSAQAGQDGPLGYGWTHNLDIRLRSSNDGALGLSGRQPVDMASVLVGKYVISDIMKNQPDLLGWVTSALVANWTVDQLKDNAVNVTIGNQVMKFVKVYVRNPDDTFSVRYEPPPGQTASLVKNADNTSTLKERFGTRLEFDSAGYISQLVDINGNAMTFHYTQQQTGMRLDSVTDSENRTMTLVYAGNRIASVTDSFGRIVAYGYDANGNLTTSADLESKIWTYAYDSEHRMVSITDPKSVATVTNVYDSLGRISEQTEPRQTGNAQFNFYFTKYRSLRDNSYGEKDTLYFDDKGRTVEVEDALGVKTFTTYDGQNHLLTEAKAVIDSDTEEDIQGKTTTYEYDGNNNLRFITDPLGHKTEFTYDAQFRRTGITDPLSHTTTFGYDDDHHPTSITDAEDNTAATAYYANGLVHTTTDPRKTVANITYDNWGNPKTSKVGSQPQLTTAYDGIGRMTSLTNQVGATTDFNYDKRGLLRYTHDPLKRKTSYYYDDAGRLASRKDRKNQTITYGYTPTGKLETVTYPDLSTVTFTYNLHDRLVGMKDALTGPDIPTSYVHDAVGRILSATDSQGFTVGYTYDDAGNVETITYPGDKTVTYTYDALNRLETVTDWLDRTATYTYDEAGRLDYVENLNGTVTTYGYDNANRLIELSEKTDAEVVIADYRYILDPNGNRIQEVQTEPLDPPAITASTLDYTYNLERNRLDKVGPPTVPLNDRTAFTYDDEGQLSGKSGIAYTFDYEHRLVKIDTTTTDDTTHEFFYDGAGRRLKTVRKTVSTGATVTTKYIYDLAGNLLAEADGANNILRYYIHGLGLMAMVTPAGESYTYHYNGVGSTVAMTDNAGTVKNSYAYSPFGEVLAETLSADQTVATQPFKFVGKYGVTAETGGLYHMRARYYDPQVGRFISEDPIGFEGGDVNLYGYVGNNPVMRIDPAGLSGLLTIYSSGSSDGSLGSGGISGHSWISYTPDGSATTTTYGTWGNLGPRNGLNINRELNYKADVSRGAHLNDEQEISLFGIINNYKEQGADGWGYLAPCSTFACDAWNSSTGENLNPYGPYSNPSTLKDSISNANKGTGSCHR